VIQSPRRNFARLSTCGVLVAVLIAALSLTGCGRKTGLDAPPMAAAGDVQASPQPGAAPVGAAPGGVVAGGVAPAAGPDGKPAAPLPLDKRKTPLDWLLN
jgi:predicted small lipoprotein YifL